MLHEILLSLSGHPSPLFDAHGKGGRVATDAFPLTTPSETILIASLGELSRLHRSLRIHTAHITSSHPSTICRAVANSIASTHLARFRQKILDVEAEILTKDAGTVAAYDIVPLADIVGEFDEWRRRMNWYWEVSCYMEPASQASSRLPKTTGCSGADLINWLRKETQTGYPDIEAAAIELEKVAESAWLRQLTSWVLYGRLPTFGTGDFFVTCDPDSMSSNPDFSFDSKLLPKFVSTETAISIAFVGKILNQIRSRGLAGSLEGDGHIPSDLELLPDHLKLLSALHLPLTAASLSSAISSIRSSLSQRTLQRLLPLSKIVQILDLLEDFFLLRRGEFATTLIKEVDERLDSRKAGGKAADGVRNLVLKEPELAGILNRTFATLMSLESDDSEDGSSDSILDLAQSLVKLNVGKPPRSLSTSFSDVLLPMPTALTLSLSSPLDLFLAPSDLAVYSCIHSYLLSIRRAHMHLASLWRLTSIRREHPAPAGPPLGNSKSGREMLKKRRSRRNRRELAMRKVWATCGKAVLFLSELTNFLEGVVVKDASEYLFTLLVGEPDRRPGSSLSSSRPLRPGTATGAASINSSSRSGERHETSFGTLSGAGPASSQGRPKTAPEKWPSNHDPTALAGLHTTFLTSLEHALLLSRAGFPSHLRQLLTNVDGLVGQIRHLQHVQSNLDLEEDEGVVDALNDWRKDESACLLEVDRGRKKIDEGLRACIDELAAIDAGGGGDVLLGGGSSSETASSVRAPDPRWNWRPPALDRLLMKLEYGRLEGGGGNDDDAQ